MTTAREAAARVLLRVERDGAYLTVAMEEGTNSLSERRERAFFSRLARGTLERQITLDSILAPHLSRPMGKLDPEIRVVLRLGAYQLLFMEDLPTSAAVNESVALCTKLRKTSAKGFVNGVLRALLRKKDAAALTEDQRLSVPKALYESLCGQLGCRRATAFLEDSLLPTPAFLRVNTTKCTRDELAALLAEEGVETKAVEGFPNALEVTLGGDLQRLRSFSKGLFHQQDISSQKAAELLGAQPGDRVLDCCAAPGGKSFTIAESMGDTGEIVSGDIYPARVALMEKSARRLGLSAVKPAVRDAGEPPQGEGAFQRVLCDLPCSGLGIIRRKPEIKYKPFSQFLELPALQGRLLGAAATALSPGGRLVYSTCTLREEENAHVVRRFLRENGDFYLLEELLPGGMITLCPGEEYRGDGFFIAVLGRR